MRQRESHSPPLDGTIPKPAAPLHLDLLGAFRLRQEERSVAGFEHARLQQALAYLALHRAVPVSRQQLAFLFWPDSTDPQALKNLRTLLTRLRQALPDADRLIEITAETLQLRPEAPFTLDVAEFEAAFAQAARAQAAHDDEAALSAWAAAVEAYTGELLPDCYDDWILPLRERLHQACSEALEQLIRRLEERRQYRRALPYARRLLNHDPLHEAAYHHLIRLHLALDDRTEALRLCRLCDAMLEQEFGMTAGRATRDRYERLLEAEDQTGPGIIDQQVGRGFAGPPLVGRNAEWLRLMAAWRAALAGQAHMLLLSGEAGIGKTRLAEEFCAWVARQGVAVATAHCYPAGGGAVAYAPIGEWLHQPGLQPRWAGLDDVWLVEVARIFPMLLARRPQLKSSGLLNEAWQRTRLFEALARAVLGPNERAPLLLFLDDLQWCDQETLDWLGYLLRFAARAPVLIVAAVRKYEIDRVHPLTAFWLSLTRSGLLSEVPLEPLDALEAGQLAAHVAGRALEAWEATRIYQDTEGNPLFVVEMMRAGMTAEEAAGETGRQAQVVVDEKGFPAFLPIPATPVALPPKVRAVIHWRLGQLSTAGQTVVQTAAVIGRTFSFELLAETSGQDSETVIQGLDELWRRQVVRSQDGTVFDFSHDGLRVVAYDDTGLVRRRAIHLRVAQALEKLHPEDLDAYSSQIAGHYEQAGQYQPAITFYRQAASRAQAVYANTAAARLYQHLLESELSTGLSVPEKSAVKLALAEVWRLTGQWVRAEAITREALVEAEALDDKLLVARAQRALGDVLHLLGYYEAALQWLAKAEQGFEAAGEWRGVASALWITGEIHWLRGNPSQALAVLERQLEIASTMDDPHGTCAALEAIGMVLWSQGEWERAADHCLRAIRIASPLEYKPVLTRAAITLGNIRAGEHWFGEAVYWFQHAGVLATQTDDRRALAWAISSVAGILAKRGDYERAGTGYERSLRIAWEIGDRWAACLNVAGLGALNENLGRASEAEALYRKGIACGLSLNIPGFLAGMHVNLARGLLAQGRLQEAHRAHAEAMAQISSVAGQALAGEDVRFEAQLLDIHLRRAEGETTGEAARADLRTLLLQAGAPLQQAAVYYELWRLAPEDEAARAAAADLYRIDFTETGAEESRRRYEELSGEQLPDPPPLPDSYDLIPDTGKAPDVAALLDELDGTAD